MQKLCNGDLDRPIYFEIFDWNRSGTHELIGACSVRCLSLSVCVRVSLSLSLSLSFTRVLLLLLRLLGGWQDILRFELRFNRIALQATLRQLQESTAPLEIPVIEETIRRKKGASYTNSGYLICNKVEIYREPTFLEFVAGGCEISLMVAVDFTASNGCVYADRLLFG